MQKALLLELQFAVPVKERHEHHSMYRSSYDEKN